MSESTTRAALSIIRETRGMLMPLYGKVEEVSRKGGGAHSVVTERDIAVEDFLADRLRKVDPGIGFVGEERGGDRTKERFWLCDPIDGTVHYVRGSPFCTVLLARIEGGVVTFGAIYDFVRDILYHAEEGSGAFANDERISVKDRPAEDAYIFLESRLDRSENRGVRDRLQSQFALPNLVCSGAEFALVASGVYDAHVNFDPYGKDYDYASGALLVREAGGIVANIGKCTYDYRNLNFIAASPSVFSALTTGEDAIFPIL